MHTKVFDGITPYTSLPLRFIGIIGSAASYVIAGTSQYKQHGCPG